MLKNTLAVITARGGSKRIPGKNIKSFCGKPIIEYSIKTALDSNLFDDVIISTDDIAIAEIAISAGATFPFIRSAENSNDFVGTADVLCEVVESFKNINVEYENACCLYPTAPFITIESLKNGFKLFKECKYDVVFPSVKYSYPVQRSINIDSSLNNKVNMLWPENYTKRSQDLEPVYHDAGQFYWFCPATMLIKRRLFTDNTGSIVINELMVQDIDTIEDWQIAEIKYRILKERL